MTVSKWMTAGTVLKMMAMHYPDKPGAADKLRKMTFKSGTTGAVDYPTL